MTRRATIVLISSGQPSLNPRLVKEADTLSSEGYNVTVVYQYWNNWGTEIDEDLLKEKHWKAIRVGGTPQQNKLLYWLTVLIYKLSRLLAHYFSMKHFAEMAIGRCTWLLSRQASKIKADLYIGHNLAALPAAVSSARRNRAKCGFDAEDFHRNEVSDDPLSFDVQIKSYIENKYLPQLNYLTASSRQIMSAYLGLFPGIKISGTIRNVFPVPELSSFEDKKDKPLRLFWFSQTIGTDRGLDVVIRAIGELPQGEIELHLLGYNDDTIKLEFSNLALKYGFDENALYFYKPVQPEEIFQLASQFDIGIASENSTPFNRNICLTNKLFTYLQSGLTILASDTLAQSEFIKQYPAAGSIYPTTDHKALSGMLKKFMEDRPLLDQAKRDAFELSIHELNWEIEQVHFKEVINTALNNSDTIGETQ